MNKKSLLDRDNIELFISNSEGEQLIGEILLDESEWVDELPSPDALPKLQPWQEEILNREINK